MYNVLRYYVTGCRNNHSSTIYFKGVFPYVKSWIWLNGEGYRTFGGGGGALVRSDMCDTVGDFMNITGERGFL
jgi:hypothetical protein